MIQLCDGRHGHHQLHALLHERRLLLHRRPEHGRAHGVTHVEDLLLAAVASIADVLDRGWEVVFAHFVKGELPEVGVGWGHGDVSFGIHVAPGITYH